MASELDHDAWVVELPNGRLMKRPIYNKFGEFVGMFVVACATKLEASEVADGVYGIAKQAKTSIEWEHEE